MLTYIGKTVKSLLESGAWKATTFISPTKVVKATKRSGTKNSQRAEVVLTLGKPNYAEREAIKKFKKAGEPFPVKKVQLKFKRVK